MSMQSLNDTESFPHTVTYRDHDRHQDSYYQIIYVQQQNEQVTVVEAPTIPFDYLMAWLQMGNAIFITQKHPDRQRTSFSKRRGTADV